jgi:CBS domain-containing protein
LIVSDDFFLPFFLVFQMNRVVSKELPLNQTEVSSVMTPNPDYVSPEISALEALEIMHSGKFLSLPVVANDNTVLGVVNVMDVIAACGGAEGWRSIFSSTLDMDDLSETSSVRSGVTGVDRGIFNPPSENTTREEKTVANLRPKKPVFSNSDDSIFDVSMKLASQRADAAIIVGPDGSMSGIITDTDFTRRVVSKGIDPSNTPISEVMTPSPQSVTEIHPGIEAIATMIENRFRHLPVLGTNEEVVGLLDIARCLNDAISKLERSVSAKPNATETLLKEALVAAGGVDAAALHALLQPLLTNAAGSNAGTRTLGSVLSGVPKTIVAPDTTVKDAASLMSENRKAALVVEDGELVGIFGFKDLMTRLLAKGLDPESTLVSDVMTADPEAVGPDMTALDALRFMHDNRFLTLPCCDDSGAVVGLVDVMDVVHAIGGAEQWRALFDAALQMDDVSDVNSATKSMTPSKKGFPTIRGHSGTEPPALPSNIPSTLEFQEGANEEFDENTLNDTTYRMETGSLVSEGNVVVFKIVDRQGHTHRVRSEPKILNLRNAIADKLDKGQKAQAMRFKYMDEEGDAVLVTTDDDLLEAVTIARAANPSQGSKLVVKLLLEEGKSGAVTGLDDPIVMTGIGITIAAVAVGALMLMKPSGRY